MSVRDYLTEKTGEMYKDIDKVYFEMNKVSGALMQNALKQVSKKMEMRFKKDVRELEKKHGLQAIGELKALLLADPNVRKVIDWI